MREFTQIENRRVEIWRRAYQRSLNLTVRPDGVVRVTCGRRVPQAEVKRFVRESEPFILKRMLEIEKHRRQYPQPKFLSGESLLIHGVPHTLEIIWTWTDRTKVKLRHQQIEMLAPLHSTRSVRQAAFYGFCRREARRIFNERVEVLGLQMGLIPKSISVRGQRTRWGSCTSHGEISLNWKLLAAPRWVLDYVVVHELAHIQHMNHSQAFWHLVGQHHGDWQAARRWLKDHEPVVGAQFGAPVQNETDSLIVESISV